MTENDNSIIGTDSPLTDLQLRWLESSLDVIIPPGENSSMPGASQMDLRSYLRERRAEEVRMLGSCLDALAEFAGAAKQKSSTVSGESGETQLILDFSRDQSDLWQMLVLTIYSCYYQDEQVLVALGMDPRPPFPRGNEVEPGNLSLLDPVRRRKPFYRQ